MNRRGERPRGNAGSEPSAEAMMQLCGRTEASQVWGASIRLRSVRVVRWKALPRMF